jgi:hypothetical protein
MRRRQRTGKEHRTEGCGERFWILDFGWEREYVRGYKLEVIWGREEW